MRKLVQISILALALGSARGAAAQPEAQAPARVSVPLPGAPPEIKLPELQYFVLPNGLQVYFMEKPGLPVANFRLLVRSGTADETPEQLGLAELTMAMLSEGAGELSAGAIAEARAQLGVSFSASTATDYCTISLYGPVRRIPAALAILRDVVAMPQLDSATLELKRKEQLRAIYRYTKQVGSIANEAFKQLVIGFRHPMGRIREGRVEAVESFKLEDVRAFHKRHYVPSNAQLVVVGALSRAELETMLASSLAMWQGGPAPEHTPMPSPPQVKGRKIYLVNIPGFTQSQIVLGRVGPPRTSRLYPTIEVVNALFGGTFNSRLNTNLREKNQYTYGAQSAMIYGRKTGYFTAASRVQARYTTRALREMLTEMAHMNQITPRELDFARHYVAYSYIASLAGVRGLANRLEDLALYGLPGNELNTYTGKVLAVTEKQFLETAFGLLDPANVVIVVIGDRERILNELANSNLGEVDKITPFDVFGFDVLNSALALPKE